MSRGVVAIVPAYNEAERLGLTLRSLSIWLEPKKILVVDDGSTDATSDIARSYGARLVRLESNRGKAHAVAAGVAETSEPYLLFVDADLAGSAWATVRLLEPVLRDEADMVVASWGKAGRRGGFGLVKRFAQWWLYRLTGQRFLSPLSGQRALRREVWEAFRGCEGFGFEVALTLDALRSGFRVQEMPLALTHRETGRGLQGFVHRGKQFSHIVRALWERRNA